MPLNHEEIASSMNVNKSCVYRFKRINNILTFISKSYEIFAYFALNLKFSYSNNLIQIEDVNAALIKLKSIS